MEIQRTTRDGCLVVTFIGTIDLSSVPWIQRTLLKELSERPFTLVCDLSGVSILDPVCAAVFTTVANHPSSRWPDTSFLLCGAQPSVARILSRLQVPHFLHLYANVEKAVDAAVARPPYLRDELLLAPTPTAPAAARAFVQQVCAHWQLALPDELHVGVRDGDPWLLRLVSPDTEAEGGRGLWLVEQLAEAWGGVHHHPSGGKVVWCTLNL
jgi:anti-anti-sigma factor